MVEPAVDCGPRGNPPRLPGKVLPAIFFCLSVLTCPPILETFVSLDWRLGNMRPGAYALEGAWISLAFASLLARRRVNCLFAKVFRTTKNFVFAAVAVSLSLLLSLVAAEIILRLLHLPFQQKWPVSENAMARFDPELGWSYIPNQSVIQAFGSEGRKVAMYFDRGGHRVQKPGMEPESTVPTVLFMGDSYTFGHGLPYEETFVGRLASMSGFPFQVVDLGVQAYGTDQALLYLKREFKKFNTRVVVYSFIPLHVDRNAIYDVRVFHPRTHFLGTKPQFAIQHDGKVYLKKSPVKFEDLCYSRLWACVQIALARYGPKPSTDLTRALVMEMKHCVESNGGVFFVLNWDQGRSSRFVTGDVVFQGLNLNLIEAGANAPRGWNTWRIKGDGHPDARAHLYVAELIYRELKKRLQEAGAEKGPLNLGSTIPYGMSPDFRFENRR